MVLSHMPQQEKCYLLFEKKSEESIFTLCSLKIKSFKTRQNAYDRLWQFPHQILHWSSFCHSCFIFFFFLKYLKVNYITNHQGNANQNHNEISSHTIRMVIIKKIRKKINVGEDLGKKVLCIVNGNENWCSHYKKQYGGLSKN